MNFFESTIVALDLFEYIKNANKSSDSDLHLNILRHLENANKSSEDVLWFSYNSLNFNFVMPAILLIYILTAIFPLYFLPFFFALILSIFFAILLFEFNFSTFSRSLFSCIISFIILFYFNNFITVYLFLCIAPFLVSFCLRKNFYLQYSQTKNKQLFYFYASNLAYLLAMSIVYYVSFDFCVVHFKFIFSFLKFLFHCVSRREFNFKLFFLCVYSLFWVFLYTVLVYYVTYSIVPYLLFYIIFFVSEIIVASNLSRLFCVPLPLCSYNFHNFAYFYFSIFVFSRDVFFGKILFVFQVIDMILLFCFEKDFELVRSDKYPNEKVFDDYVLKYMDLAASINNPNNLKKEDTVNVEEGAGIDQVSPAINQTLNHI